MTADQEMITKLESLLMHQDQQIQDLSEMVNRQWQEIDLLKRKLGRTENRLNSLENPEEDQGPVHEVPPHY